MGLTLWIAGCATLVVWVILRNVLYEYDSCIRDGLEEEAPANGWYTLRDVLPAIAVGLLIFGLFYY